MSAACYGFLALIAIGLIVFSIIDARNTAPFLLQSINFSSWLRSLPYLSWLFWFYAIPCHLFAKILPFLLLYFLNDKNLALRVFIFSLLGEALAAALRSLYSESRPCFEFQQMSNFGCACSFGKPSSSAFTATLFYLLLAWEVLAPRIQGGLKYLVYFLGLGIIVGTCFSQLYYGVASWNQVLLGFLWGALLFAVFCSFNELIKQGIESLLVMNSNSSGLRTITCLGYILTFIALNIIVIVKWFKLTRGAEAMKPHPFAHSVCAQKCLAAQPFFADYDLESIALANFAMFLVGIWLTCFPPPTPFSPVFCRNQWNGVTVALLRILVWILVSLPIFVALWVAAKFSGWKSFWLITAMGLLWAILFRFVMLPLLKAFRSHIVGDFFNNEHGPSTMVYAQLQETTLSVPRN